MSSQQELGNKKMNSRNQGGSEQSSSQLGSTQSPISEQGRSDRSQRGSQGDLSSGVGGRGSSSRGSDSSRVSRQSDVPSYPDISKMAQRSDSGNQQQGRRQESESSSYGSIEGGGDQGFSEGELTQGRQTSEQRANLGSQEELGADQDFAQTGSKHKPSGDSRHSASKSQQNVSLSQPGSKSTERGASEGEWSGKDKI
jgi:hypothetical protein